MEKLDVMMIILVLFYIVSMVKFLNEMWKEDIKTSTIIMVSISVTVMSISAIIVDSIR